VRQHPEARPPEKEVRTIKDEQVKKGLRLLISDLEPGLRGKPLSLGKAFDVLEKHADVVSDLSIAEAAREGFRRNKRKTV